MCHASVTTLFQSRKSSILGAPMKCAGTSAGDLPVGDRLVIGLNPPFGKNNMLASMFVRHAATFHPRVIVLIVPPGVRIPRGYQVMYEEQDTMRDRCATHVQPLI